LTVFSFMRLSPDQFEREERRSRGWGGSIRSDGFSSIEE
jgi:hypothetical protein